MCVMVFIGVTRDSILSIVRGWSDKRRGVASADVLPHTLYDDVDDSLSNVTVSERFLTMKEIVECSKEGRVSVMCV